jgi:glucose uptake protein
MIIPATNFWTLVVLVVAMVCWAGWANAQKAAGKHRYELFYFDFSFGALIGAVIIAYTFGTLGDDLTFEDNIAIAGRRPIAIALLAGAVFNLANILMLAGVTVAGLSIAYPICFGIAMAISPFLNGGSPEQAPLIAGLALAAVVAGSLAHHWQASAVKTGKKTPSGVKGICLAGMGGVIMGFYPVLVGWSRATDVGLGPYTAVVFMTIGIVVSSLLYNLFLMNLPVQGEPLALKKYFAVTKGQHAWGLVGGMIWAAGAVAGLVAEAAPQTAVSPAMTFTLQHGSIPLAAIFGFVFWREFRDAPPKASALFLVMFVLFGAALAVRGLG